MKLMQRSLYADWTHEYIFMLHCYLQLCLVAACGKSLAWLECIRLLVGHLFLLTGTYEFMIL